MLVELTCGSVLSDAFAVSCGRRTEEGFNVFLESGRLTLLLRQLQ